MVDHKHDVLPNIKRGLAVGTSVQEAEKQKVEGGREGRGEHERQRHVDGVEVVLGVQSLVPVLVRAIQHQLRREGCTADERPHRMDRWHQHKDFLYAPVEG